MAAPPPPSDLPTPSPSLMRAPPPTTPSPPQRLLILVGLPGSGKSTAAATLESRGWVRINQDTLGSRPACEAAASAALAAGRSVVVDRVNFDVRQRGTWVALARSTRVPVAALELRLPIEVCVARAMARTDHPTIAPPEAAAVVARLAADYVPPNARAERLDAVWVATSDGEVAACVARVGAGAHGVAGGAPPRNNAVPGPRVGGGGRPPQPGELVPRHLDTPLGLDPRPLILFDLNDTLASSTRVRKRAGRITARPALASLLPLKPRLRFGLFTSATVPTVAEALPVLAAAAGGCLFDAATPTALILHRGHTQPAPAQGAKTWATFKPIAPWFAAPHRVLVIDDDTGKVAPCERDHFVCVPAWGDDQPGDDAMLPVLAAALAAHVAPLAGGEDVRPAGRRVEAAVAARARVRV